MPDILEVYLNLPYGRDFEDLLLAYMAGLTTHGLRPRAALEITGGERRLNRIIDLVRRCRYSVHELTPPAGGLRLNMGFELGLAVSHYELNPSAHTFFVFETRRGRIARTLSDLNGTDIHIHGGKRARLFGELANAFVRSKRQPSVAEMERVFAGLKESQPAILRTAGTRTPFTARVFDDLRIVAAKLSGNVVD